ncbi:unnamed protein product [Cylicocyclus nassatus]|uniref:Uncharacterized protein n=1 Tax=Cylicocyclus nassatus TaxID=53992 RepID=A0AA36H3F4_CYLNA|nr:unnamed protein product [Cylicocyclus nassatus]
MTFFVLILAVLWPLPVTPARDYTVPQPQHPYGTPAVTSGAAIFHINQPELKQLHHPGAQTTRHSTHPELSDGPTPASNEIGHHVKRHLASITSLPHKEIYVTKRDGRMAFVPDEPGRPPADLIKAPLWVEHVPTKSKHKFTIANLGQSELVMQQFYKGANGGRPYVTTNPEATTTTSRPKAFSGRDKKDAAEKIIKQELNRARVAKYGKSASGGGAKRDENSSGINRPPLQESGYSGEPRKLTDWSLNNNRVDEFPNGYDGLSALPVNSVSNTKVVLSNEVIEEPTTEFSPTTAASVYTLTPPSAPPTIIMSVAPLTLPPSHPLCAVTEASSSSSFSSTGPAAPPTDARGPHDVEYALPKTNLIGSVDGAVMSHKEVCRPCESDSTPAQSAPATLAPIAPLPSLSAPAPLPPLPAPSAPVPPVPAPTSVPLGTTQSAAPSTPENAPLHPAPYQQPNPDPGSVLVEIPPSPVVAEPAPEPVPVRTTEIRVEPAVMPGSNELEEPVPSPLSTADKSTSSESVVLPDIAKTGPNSSLPTTPAHAPESVHKSSEEDSREGNSSSEESPQAVPAPAPSVAIQPAPLSLQPEHTSTVIPPIASSPNIAESNTLHPAPSSSQHASVPSFSILTEFKSEESALEVAGAQLAERPEQNEYNIITGPVTPHTPSSLSYSVKDETPTIAITVSPAPPPPPAPAPSTQAVSVSVPAPSSNIEEVEPAPIVPAFVQQPDTSGESTYSNLEEDHAEPEKPAISAPGQTSAFEQEPAPELTNNVDVMEGGDAALVPAPSAASSFVTSSVSHVNMGSSLPSSSGYSSNSGGSFGSRPPYSSTAEITPAPVPAPTPAPTPAPAPALIPAPVAVPAPSPSQSFTSISEEYESPAPSSATKEAAVVAPQYINASPSPSTGLYKGTSQQVSYVPEVAAPIPGDIEDTQPFVPQPGPSKPESSYANLEEDHQDRGPVTIIDTESNAPQRNVGQYKEVPQVFKPSYNIPLKIRPIQVQPSSYDVSPAPIRPYAPQPLPRISIQPQSGYQGPNLGSSYQQQGGYVPPQQTGGYAPPQQTGNYVPPSPAGSYVPPPQFQPPPPPILQPQPIQFPAPPPYQPLPSYQISQPQPQPQPVPAPQFAHLHVHLPKAVTLVAAAQFDRLPAVLNQRPHFVAIKSYTRAVHHSSDYAVMHRIPHVARICSKDVVVIETSCQASVDIAPSGKPLLVWCSNLLQEKFRSVGRVLGICGS